MEFTPEQIQEFTTLYKQEFGIKLTDIEAYASLRSLVSLAQIAYENPIMPETTDPIKEYLYKLEKPYTVEYRDMAELKS